MHSLLQTALTTLVIALPALVLAPPAQAANTTAAEASPAPLSVTQTATNTVFIEETARLRGKAVPFQIGNPVTPFVLHDQDGRPIQLPTAFKGRFIVVSFIFTRCQVATMCPTATSKMTRLQRETSELGLGATVQFVSITFDPRYDTPAVMRQYAQMFGAKTDNYVFLTGESKLTDALLRRFGILTRNANDTIVHTMTTSLIAPDGTLVLQQIGSDWQTQTFLEYIREHSPHP